MKRQYKEKPNGFGNIHERRLIRAEKHKELRKICRDKVIAENRNVLDTSAAAASQNIEVVLTTTENRMTKLRQWKAERDKRKRMEQAKKKPPFVVGLVHHKLYSPVNKDEIVVPVVPHGKSRNRIAPVVPTSPIKRITRATEKRLMSKTVTKKAAESLIKNSNSTGNKEQKVEKKQEHSFAPADYKFKLPAGLHQVPLFGRVAPYSVSPATVSEFVSSFSRITRASKKNTTEFTEVEIHNEVSEEDSSIETIRLNVSSDEKETSNSFNNSIVNSNSDDISDSEKEKLNDKQPNNSIAQVNKALDNSTKEADIIFNNNDKGASFTNNNTPTSVQSDSPSEPVFFSPYVVSSRGKSSARKEQQLKRGFSLGCSRSDDIPTKNTIMQNLNISIEEEERTAQYFQFLLNKEISRLRELCKKWEEVKTESKITEDAQYQINQAIGQTNLLISRKFERFRGLVSDCETGKGEMLVTCKDLQGFWDMMYMEVKNCDSRFGKLEQLHSRNWEEEQPPVVTKPLIRKKTATKKKTLSTKSSSLREFLTDRKMKMTQEIGNKDGAEEFEIRNNIVSTDKHEHHESNPNVKYRTRRSTSVGPHDKKFTSVKHEETRLSLLKKTQLSETKKLTSPLTVIKISQMCKTPEMCKTLSYFNSSQTPGKSILKQPKDSTEIESHTKITHKVNFDDTIVLNEVPVDEETQTKMDLAATLSRIDSFDYNYSDDDVAIHAERKLNFIDNTFEGSKNVFDVSNHSELNDSKDKNTNEIPTIQIQCETPFQESVLNNNSNTLLTRRILRRQNAVHENDEISEISQSFNITAVIPLKEITDDTDTNILTQKLQKQISINDKEETVDKNESIRVLRNRSIVSASTPNHKKTSRKTSINVKESEHKENKTPSGARRKSSQKVTVKDDEKINSKIDLQDAIDNMNLDGKSSKRRSSRRSVKFSEKESCIENKPVLPMTPHVTRSKIQLIEKQKRTMVMKGGISVEIPEKVPERVRRSHNRKVKSVG